MKITSTIILILSVLINIILFYVFIFKGETAETADNRIELTMSETNRDFVLLEMRDFLESIQQINEGILKNKPKLIIKAAKHSGGSVIAHAPQGLLKGLPIGFKELGFSTHDLFDEIGQTTADNYDAIKVQTQLNSLLNKCTACHQSYKIQAFVK